MPLKTYVWADSMGPQVPMGQNFDFDLVPSIFQDGPRDQSRGHSLV